jgi:hypothetical protein
MKVGLTVVLLLICASGWAATTQCVSTFSSIQADVKWCVTQNGNIAFLGLASNGGGDMFEGNEGYMIQDTFACYADNGQSDTGNWQASIVTEPNGPNTFPLTIARTTTDNRYTLTQKFSWGENHSAIMITMSVTGDFATTFLWRYGDVVYGGSNQWMDYTDDTAFIWSSGTVGRKGLLAKSIPPFHVLELGSDPNAIGGIQNLCAGIDGTKTQFPFQGDSALALDWHPANKAFVATMEYITMH